MATKNLKRRGATDEDECETPTGKKQRSSEKPSANRGGSTSTNRRSGRLTQETPPVFVIEEETDDMASSSVSKSPKPPTAEEFKAMLREGLANVAKKEQIDQMMAQSEAIQTP